MVETVLIRDRLQAGRQGFNSRQGQWRDFFSSPPHPDQNLSPPSPLSNGNRELLPRG